MVKWDFGIDAIQAKNEVLATPVFAPLNVKRTYGVVLVETNETQKKTQIHYKVDVICIEETRKEHYIFELQKQQVFVNEKKPDGVLEELLARCGAVLYPLQIEVSALGQVLHITNIPDIQERWAKEKQHIVKTHKGKTTQLLVEKMDAVVNDGKQLTALLFQREWFINLIFAPIYNPLKTRKVQYPLLPYVLPIAYTTTRKAIAHQTKEGAVLLKFKGVCSDKRSEKDILNGYAIPVFKAEAGVRGALDMVYQLYKNAPMVDAITGTVNVDFPSGKTQHVAVEIYNLKTETPQSAKEKQEAIAKREAEAPQPKQKKKRYFLFGKEIKLGK